MCRRHLTDVPRLPWSPPLRSHLQKLLRLLRSPHLALEVTLQPGTMLVVNNHVSGGAASVEAREWCMGVVVVGELLSRPVRARPVVLGLTRHLADPHPRHSPSSACCTAAARSWAPGATWLAAT